MLHGYNSALSQQHVRMNAGKTLRVTHFSQEGQMAKSMKFGVMSRNRHNEFQR